MNLGRMNLDCLCLASCCYVFVVVTTLVHHLDHFLFTPEKVFTDVYAVFCEMLGIICWHYLSHLFLFKNLKQDKVANLK